MFAELGSIMTVFTPTFLLVMLAGVFGGLVIGALPGLTSTMAVALLVPITYGMTMELGIAMLVAVYIGAISGGLVSAALLNIPGTPSSVATTFDAYPMVQRGEAGRALAIGVFASCAGGFFSFIAMISLSPLLGRFALRFASYEYFALVIFTLTCIISLSRASLVKGIISACLGLLMACTGLSDIDSAVRFTFGFNDLQAGFSVLPVLIGMYAVSQIMEEVRRINEPYKLTYAHFTWREFWRVVKTDFTPRDNVWNFFRSALIGTGIGILPGVGPGLSNIMAYAQAKSSSQDPESFG
jgi:putative tricarboxylic transport membrane protein